ncbi:hypothetical protein HJ588_12755 [Flexivirga sp. ID2601S]|uniref:Uncharacterized protein n=1 Tax=Flexivirga aerilata TaxID=1656889 RepID=A0A849AH13_9MICO|nr:hypothetical protein [Flexivirga aerilata]NNG40134.1 hypothetical protein [Flexivirga aerilata]
MADITTFFIGFMIINAIALALFVAFAATELTKFFTANRKQRLARHEPFVSYYRGLAVGH